MIQTDLGSLILIQITPKERTLTRSLGSRFIKGTDESVTRVDSSVPLMHHDPSDLGSLILIQITPKERTLTFYSSEEDNIYQT